MYHHGETLIKLTHHDETKKRAHDPQTVRAKENLKLNHGGSSYRLSFSKIFLVIFFKYGCQTSEASLDVCLLIIFSDRLNPDQGRQNVSPDLSTNCLKV